MRIAMFTNTYLPHVGGVAQSVDLFTRAFRERGHRVLVIAPDFDEEREDEPDVVRVPAITDFYKSDFSVSYPIPGLLKSRLDEFQPEILHAHHPFVLGDTALRVAAGRRLPLVFTHHTRYERYTHFVPGDSPWLKRFAASMATGYANLCDRVIAPSESIESLIRERGVTTPIEVIPTGVDLSRFGDGDRARGRDKFDIPEDAFLIGHVGRLAPEKNLRFLAKAVARALKELDGALFLCVGDGSSREETEGLFEKEGISDRVRFPGKQSGQDLIDAYHAMDLFAFASTSETQGMVVAEAMATGSPVVAVDASGVREVVRDGQNGRMLAEQDAEQFANALAELARDADRLEAMRQGALETAQDVSLEACADRALALYEELAGSEPKDRDIENSLWDMAVRRLEAEWKLWVGRAEAARRATRRRRWLIPSVAILERWWRTIRRRVSRSEWFAHILPGETRPRSHEPGLIMLQIDGLSLHQFQRAMAAGRLPFLRRLRDREHFKIGPMFSGVPSTTPAVQGELFYGVRQAVPAFAYREASTGRLVRMYEPPSARAKQEELARSGQGLLEGGSAYSNVYTGGAVESKFCISSLMRSPLSPSTTWPRRLLFFIAYFPSLLRALGLILVETALAIVDFIRGVHSGQDLVKELKFIPTRAGIGVLMRELITIGVTIDTARGLPVIHANFIGYDEPAHRRGPDSAFAHWSLKGIDGCLRRIYRGAMRSSRRRYHVWVYADHGQESTIPYHRERGETIQQAAARIAHRIGAEGEPVADDGERPVKRPERASSWLLRWLAGGVEKTEQPGASLGVQIAALGPLGHLYVSRPLTQEERQRFAEALVEEAGVPLVLHPDGERTLARTSEGVFTLEESPERALGKRHPFLQEAAADLASLCRHPDAGQLILSGWRTTSPSITFAVENGSHAGPGAEETSAWFLVPPDVPLATDGSARPMDLRRAALVETGHGEATHRPAPTDAPSRPLRMMTYNVHGCLGMDGRRSTERIARVIAQYDPDIVVLQELDVGRDRSEKRDQAEEIAHELRMDFHFAPSLKLAEGEYGNAVLSRLPMRLVRNAALPQSNGFERRGALWVEVEVDGARLQVVTAHLDLRAKARLAQMEALLGPDWIGAAPSPVVLAGDFNAGPRSKTFRTATSRLRDAQEAAQGHRPRATWFGRYPLARIDHVFVDDAIEVRSCLAPRTDLTRDASDHLPLVVELEVPAASPSEHDAPAEAADDALSPA